MLKYEGEWEKNFKQGNGTETYRNGEVKRVRYIKDVLVEPESSSSSSSSSSEPGPGPDIKPIFKHQPEILEQEQEQDPPPTKNPKPNKRKIKEEVEIPISATAQPKLSTRPKEKSRKESGKMEGWRKVY